MSKSITSFPENRRDLIVGRRIKHGMANGVGLGVLAAMDAIGVHIPSARLSHEIRSTYYDLLKERHKRTVKGIKI